MHKHCGILAQQTHAYNKGSMYNIFATCRQSHVQCEKSNIE